MRGRAGSLSACLLVLLVALCLPLASGAQSSSERTDALRDRNASLAAQERGAVLSLYALESRLGKVRVELGALRERAARLEGQRERVRAQLQVARRSLRVSESRLAERLRALYTQGEVDPVAVILGATSLDEAVDTLDSLSRSAEQDRDVTEQTRTARRQLRAAERRLARQQAEVGRAAASAARTAAGLVATTSERNAYIARLAQQRRLNAGQIAELQRAAGAAEERAASLNAARPVAAIAPSNRAAAPVRAIGGRTLTVVALGYSLAGRTATGVPVGYGVVAVDPSVIPLGTRLTIPGYGEGVASDTGSAIRGSVIDLWFATNAEARSWGRRVVTITVH